MVIEKIPAAMKYVGELRRNTKAAMEGPNFAKFSNSHVQGRHYSPVELTVNDLLLHACETNPDKMQASFEMHKKQFTFAQMNSEAEKIGAAFLSLGELASIE